MLRSICRTDGSLPSSRALFAAALLFGHALFLVTAQAVWTRTAFAQGIPAAPPDPPCCKPGDPNCALREYEGIRVALVVGVDDYGDPGPAQDRLANLKNAKNDAREL